MSKDWDYAQMAKKASNAGGPDLWIETIKKAAYNSGASDMKNKLVVPLLLAGVGIGTAGVIGFQKFKEWIADKIAEKTLTEKEAAEAEFFLKKKLDTAIEELEAEQASDEKQISN